MMKVQEQGKAKRFEEWSQNLDIFYKLKKDREQNKKFNQKYK